MEVTRSQFTEGLKRDMYAYAFEAYDRLPTVHDKVFEVVGSVSAYEQSTNVIRGNQFVEKPETEDIVFHNPLEGYTIYGKNRTFADGVQFTMEMVDDMPQEKIANIVLSYASGWGETLNMKKETFAAQFFNYGGYTAGHDTFNSKITGVTPSDAPTALLYDGKPLFNLSNNLRPLYAGATAAYYNGLASSLDSSNLETAWLRMTSTNNVDSAGNKIALKPDTLLIPSALWFTARNILEASNVIGSANNDINKTQNLLTPLEWQYLTDTDAWFIGKARKGLKFHNRMPLTLDIWQDALTKRFYATAIARFGAHAYDWRYWVGSNFSTS